MRIPGVKTLRLSARWVRSRFTGGALILGYHRIAEAENAAGSLCVSPQRFSEQLDILSHHGEVISLGDLARDLQDGRVPQRAVVLTFDDGYADVLYNAKPILEIYEAPATVFVTTGSLGQEFWWDKLERMLLRSAKSPEELSLQMRDDGYAWVSVAPTQLPAARSRQPAIWSIHRSLASLSPAEREKAIAELRTWTGKRPVDEPSRRALTSDELIELNTGGLIEVGAHTVTHPVLADLPSPAQREEIRQSKEHLERILGKPVTSFSYPNGSTSAVTRMMVRDARFVCACASHNDVVWQESDRFHLPRFWVTDWDGETFARWLRKWLPT